MSARADAIASLWGVGRLPFGPGTWGSLAALAPGVALLALGGPLLVAAAALALAWIGVRAIAALPAETQGADSGWIVIDEAAGQWLALAGLGAVSLLGVVAAFALFRLFDIAKPWPVSWADRRHDAAGIMLDDLVAGTLAAAALLALRMLMPEVLQ
ncbi:phosphatidylglycerophosphatase A [Elioraea sp.]|uniref:phosphatidylglycerophosphatase A family protein n=1 Tax=Elioraea sp. TaxID=2185103 RepID=UPI0025C52D75|nr:phosphatidylglycerophosphatase A [Elioraea sp.]